MLQPECSFCPVYVGSLQISRLVFLLSRLGWNWARPGAGACAGLELGWGLCWAGNGLELNLEELGMLIGAGAGARLQLGWSWAWARAGAGVARLHPWQPSSLQPQTWPCWAAHQCPPLPTTASCQPRGSCPKARPLIGRPPASSEAGAPRPPTIGWGAREGWGPVGGPPIGWEWGARGSLGQGPGDWEQCPSRGQGRSRETWGQGLRR